MTRYEWVAARKAEGFPVTAACKMAGISTSTFYEWAQARVQGPTEAQWEEITLCDEIVNIYKDNDSTYGVPRIHAELVDLGWVVNRKRIERLMRELGLQGVHKPAKVRTTVPAGAEHPHVPDLIGRDFSVGAPCTRWVGDITYISTGEGWLYLASVIDLGSRRFVGYSMAEHMRTELVADALDMAIAAHSGHVQGTVMHTDRGSQYLSHDFQDQVRDAGMRQSVGRTGSCWDNAAAESLWSSLKRELVHRYRFATRAEARRAIFAWINWYNQHRRHSALGYMSPISYEQQYTQIHRGLKAS
jgi:transposase InsO family protein